MQTYEYHALEKVDRDHWFYRGKRDIVRYWLQKHLTLEKKDLVVDLGVGTGQFLSEMRPRCRTLGLEYSYVALGIAAAKGLDLACCTGDAIPLRSDTAAVVTALDVLEHLEHDREALAELIRVTRPGGLIFINAPAFSVLWSDWDVSLGHKRRYTKRTFLKIFDPRQASLLRLSYTNSFTFLPILMYRLLRSRVKALGNPRLEDQVPGPLLNRLLHRQYVAPACTGWFSPPFGSSLFAVLRKKGAERVAVG